jgi:hypothetical protein
VSRSSEEIIHKEQPKYTKEKIAQFFMVQEQPKNRKEKNTGKKSAMLCIGKVPLWRPFKFSTSLGLLVLWISNRKGPHSETFPCVKQGSFFLVILK